MCTSPLNPHFALEKIRKFYPSFPLNYTSSVHKMELSTENAHANDKACILTSETVLYIMYTKRIDLCSEIVHCEGRGIYIFFNYI